MLAKIMILCSIIATINSKSAKLNLHSKIDGIFENIYDEANDNPLNPVLESNLLDRESHNPREEREHNPLNEEPHNPREEREHNPLNEEPHNPHEDHEHSPMNGEHHSHVNGVSHSHGLDSNHSHMDKVDIGEEDLNKIRIGRRSRKELIFPGEGELTMNGGDDSKEDLCDKCLCNPTHKYVSCPRAKLSPNDSDAVFNLNADIIPVDAEYLEVVGFHTLNVMPKTFARRLSRLKRIVFKDIRNLLLQEYSLLFSPHSREHMEVVILMENCGIPSLATSTITQLSVDKHEHDGFKESVAMTRFISVHFYRCTIQHVAGYAIKKARIMTLNLTNVEIMTINEKGFDVDIYEGMVLQNSKLPPLMAHAICLHADKSVVISGNDMPLLAGHSLNIESGAEVLLEGNTIHTLRPNAFMSIKPAKEVASANIVILKNTILNADPGSFRINDNYPDHEKDLLENKFKMILCSCETKDDFRSLLGKEENETGKLLESLHRTSFCNPEEDSSDFTKISVYEYENCEHSPMLLISLSVLFAFLLLITFIVAIVCARRAQQASADVDFLEQQSNRGFSTITTDKSLTSPGYVDIGNNRFMYDNEAAPSNWVVAVPDVRTYKETELQYICEEAQPFPPAVLDIKMDSKNSIRKSMPF